MDNWLADFPYRVNIGMTTFLFAAISTFVMTALTVSYDSLRAAYANPVEVLKEE